MPRATFALSLAAAAAAAAAAATPNSLPSFPHCVRSPNTTCFSDAPTRVVPYLIDTADAALTVDKCAMLCAVDGFPVVAVTAHPAPNPAGYCYCGLAINPNATVAPSPSSCNVTCPGNGGETCGGVGYSSVYTLSCDGPLPPAPIGPPLAPGRACSQPESKAFGFCNTSLPLETRLADLVGRVALTEIGPQLTARESPSIPRLGIPAHYWGTNNIHGIAGSYCLNAEGICPTSWPDGVAMAASWNSTAWRMMGATTGIEMRALDNTVWSQSAQPAGGLTSWGPTINLLRDTRWGRSQESASEDPFLAGSYGAAVAAGLQYGLNASYPLPSRKFGMPTSMGLPLPPADAPGYLLAVATYKHFSAYSLEDYGPGDNHEWMRQTFNAVVGPFDLADSYFPIFQRAIQEGKAAGIMYAANELNGIPCCGSSFLDETLHSWGFDGYRCTDGGQIINMVVGHHFVPTLDQAIGYAVNAESDIADGSEYFSNLVEAVVNGNTTLAGAQNLLANIMRIRFRLGHFDPPEKQPYLLINASSINDAAAKESVSLASNEALVLLKNDGGVLPFGKAGQPARPVGQLAVIGPNCNSTVVLQGNYGGQFCPMGPHGPVTTCYPTIYTAIQSGYAPSALYVEGSGIDVDIGQIPAAVQAAQAADTIVMCLGLDQTQEGEQHDRYNMTLPDAQMALFDAVVQAAAGKPVVVVLVHGGSLAIPEIKDQADAILETFYPGVTAGPAIADALFGAYNPGGRLPYTVYDKAYQYQYNFTDMDIANASALNTTATGGRTYRYYTGEPLWPFGYGMSYSNFSLAWGSASPPPSGVVPFSLSANTTLPLSVVVTNAGPYDGDNVVQMYFAPVPGSFADPAPPFLPLKQLFGFTRVHVANGGTAQVDFSVGVADLVVTGADFQKIPRTGKYQIVVASSSVDPDPLTFTVVVGA